MAKKAIEKKSSIKKHPKKSSKSRTIRKPRITQTSTEVKVEKILVENFVSLQKVMTNLSVKFDNLANQISKLLELFEISAKSLSKKDFDLERGSEDKRIMEKIDNLLDQNKIIAKGLTLMHEKTPEQKFSYPPIKSPPQMQQRQAPKPPINTGGYQKSISSGDLPEKFPLTKK